MSTSEPINSTGLNKHELRKRLKAVRNSLSEDEVRIRSAEIARRFEKNINWTTISSIHTYLPIANNKEIDTWIILKWIWLNYPKIQTSTSIYGNSRAIQHAVINSDTEFEEDSLGISVPITHFKLQSLDYDQIIVPVLGYDEKLNRIGYGRGVYDSFLAKHSKANKVGLAYECSRVDSIPVESHDQQLDEIVTENKLYN